jgi:hypothetical protein
VNDRLHLKSFAGLSVVQLTTFSVTKLKRFSVSLTIRFRLYAANLLEFVVSVINGCFSQLTKPSRYGFVVANVDLSFG